MKPAPHLKLEKSKNYTNVIVCGSPERAELISRHLSKVTAQAKNREYHSYLGSYSGAPILVCSHGVGAAGAMICFQELMNVGARRLIRIGTAGGLQDSSRIGDIVVARAAIRKDGVSRLMIPLEYPACADFSLCAGLERVLGSSRSRHTAGLVLTSDLFYPGLLPEHGLDELKLYRDAGVQAVEMEIAALYVGASLRQAQAAAMVVLDGNPLKWKEGKYRPDPKLLQKSVEQMVDAALKTLVQS